MIPDKCKNWKVANHILTKWWCNFICGSLTKGKMCAPWCRVVERYGMWTLVFTIGLPLLINSGINPAIMKTHKDFIHITTKTKEEIINVTSQVQEICKDSGVKEGLVLVFPHHTSSAVYISDSDKGLTSDFLKVLRKLLPAGDDYTHNTVDPKKNADAHIKSTLTGHHIVIPITAGKLDLGPHQTIYYAEFDGMRKKKILVKLIGE